MSYVFAAPPQAVLPVLGSTDLFPIHRVYCVGRNYEDHAREMGFTEREEPFFFSKPADAIVPVPEKTTVSVPYPSASNDFHHEVELVVALGAPDGRYGVPVTPEEARSLIWGCAVGIDLTRRDLQAAFKKQSRPWDLSKGFDHSGPVSALRRLGPPGSLGPDLGRGRISLHVNGKTRQDGQLANMIWSVEEILSQLSRYVALRKGDLIFTGTPAGVGPLLPGDRIGASIEGVGQLSLVIATADPVGP
jgi:fumarylpyruvate hydrolase